MNINEHQRTFDNITLKSTGEFLGGLIADNEDDAKTVWVDSRGNTKYLPASAINAKRRKINA